MTPAEVKRAVIRDIKGWRGTFGLNEWTLNYHFERHDDGEVATCTAHWEYHEARLTFDADQMSVKDFSRDEIRRTVLHELLHCVCDGYKRYHERALLEEMVSKLTTIVVRCWEAPEPKEK